MRHTLLLLCLALSLTPEHIKRVVDGDTFILFHVGVPNEERVRLLGVDTPERGEPGYAEATAFTSQWLKAGSATLTACKRDSFGRLLATVERDGHTVAADLIAAGHGH